MKTLNELAGEHSIYSNQISSWKKQLLEEGPTLFKRRTAREEFEAPYPRDPRRGLNLR